MQYRKKEAIVEIEKITADREVETPHGLLSAKKGMYLVREGDGTQYLVDKISLGINYLKC